MCGIVGFTGSNGALPVLIDGLKKLEYRGYDSAGIAFFEDGKLNVIKAKGKVEILENKIPKNIASNCGIGHTRWATHGKPSDENSHPHIGGDGKIAVVHNGIIENYMEIKEVLESKGYVFLSETDTECIAHLIEYIHSQKKQSLYESVLEATEKIRGSYALAVMSHELNGEIIAARKDSPLVIGMCENEKIMASDIPAIISKTKEYIVLNDGEVAVLKPTSLEVYNSFGEKVIKEIKEIKWDIKSAEKDGYEHFMMKEIMEQPKAVRDTINPRVFNGEIKLEGIDFNKLKNAKNVHLVACGSALHAAIVGKSVIETLAQTTAISDIASEFRYRDPIINKDDICIIVSQSGETADTLAALRLAKSKGAYTIAIVNVVESTIAREADNVIYTMAGPEISVATTKAYSAQIAVLYMIAIKMAYLKGCISSEKSYCHSLNKIDSSIEKILAIKEDMQYLASKYSNHNSVFFLGRGLDYAAAMEASLKLKEISYIHSEAYAAGELKHGTISLIEEGTLVVAIATQEQLYEKMISNIKEVMARGAHVILFTTKKLMEKDNIGNFAYDIGDIEPMFSPSLSVVPLQMLAYYIAAERNCDIDKPRNLAKSVTVE